MFESGPSATTRRMRILSDSRRGSTATGQICRGHPMGGRTGNDDEGNQRYQQSDKESYYLKRPKLTERVSAH